MSPIAPSNPFSPSAGPTILPALAVHPRVKAGPVLDGEASAQLDEQAGALVRAGHRMTVHRIVRLRPDRPATSTRVRFVGCPCRPWVRIGATATTLADAWTAFRHDFDYEETHNADAR